MADVQFDMFAGEAKRDEGMERARASLYRVCMLREAQGIAVGLAAGGPITADTVSLWYQQHRGIDLSAELGNAMGSLFKEKGWRWTGKVVKASKTSSRARVLREWERYVND